MQKNGIVGALLALIIVIGVGLVGGNIKLLKTVFADTKVNINTAPASAEEEGAVVEGDVTYIMGPVQETKELIRRFGVFPVSEEASYYLILNLSHDQWIDAFKNGNGEKFRTARAFIYRVTDDDLKRELDNISRECLAYSLKLMSSNGKNWADVPDVSIKINGRFIDKSDDTKLMEGRNRAIAESGLNSSVMAELVIDDGSVGYTPLICVIIGALLVIVGSLSLLRININNRREKEVEYY